MPIVSSSIISTGSSFRQTLQRTLHNIAYGTFMKDAELNLQFLTSISNVMQFDQPMYVRSITLHE
jgi:hypothetical protein